MIRQGNFVSSLNNAVSMQQERQQQQDLGQALFAGTSHQHYDRYYGDYESEDHDMITISGKAAAQQHLDAAQTYDGINKCRLFFLHE